MPFAPVPVAPTIDVAKLGHSMSDLAPTEFTRDAMLGAALALYQARTPCGSTSSPRPFGSSSIT